MAITFDLSPIDGLDNQLAAKAERLEMLVGSEKTKREIRNAMKPITEDAKARIHSVKGRLVNAIETRVTASADAPTQIEVGISYKRHRNAHHAHLVEGGHGGPHPAPPHPFWAPAVEAHGEEAAQALEDCVNDLIDELFS